MARTLIECVPNFSEGRDPVVVDAIVDAIGRTPGVVVLGRESDADHNRSVVTFAGAPQAVAEAALRGIREAVERIDLSAHSGVHPRIGAADVVPFVPVEGARLEECAALAHDLGAEVWRLLKVPVYFYEAAARTPERKRLENLRRGGLAWLREHITERPPDIGEAALHPTAGATVIGARRFLVAFNVNLTTADTAIAQSIAKAIRESSGGLPALKAIGVGLASRNMAQVSMNLTDFEQTGIGQAFDAVHAQAARHGVGVATSEVIGLVPRRAWQAAAAHLARCENYTADRILEDRIEALAPQPSFSDRLDELAAPASAAGCGAAAALTGALGAALGLKAARLTKTVDTSPFEEYRRFFEAAAGTDARAYDDLRKAMKMQSDDRDSRVEAAARHAAEVPTTITERSRELDRELLRLKEAAPARLQPDIITALGLARAARAGGIAAARANLALIQDAAFRQSIEDRLDRKLAH